MPATSEWEWIELHILNSGIAPCIRGGIRGSNRVGSTGKRNGKSGSKVEMFGERERVERKRERERERLGVKYFYAYCSLINCYVVHI